MEGHVDSDIIFWHKPDVFRLLWCFSCWNGSCAENDLTQKLFVGFVLFGVRCAAAIVSVRSRQQAVCRNLFKSIYIWIAVPLYMRSGGYKLTAKTSLMTSEWIQASVRPAATDFQCTSCRPQLFQPVSLRPPPFHWDQTVDGSSEDQMHLSAPFLLMTWLSGAVYL